MRQHLGLRVLLLELQYFFHGEALVHVAGTVPEHHLPARYLIDILAQVAVGAEDDFLVLGQALHDLACVGGGDHHVGDGLDGGRGVDVGDDGVAGAGFAEVGKLVGRATLGQRARGVEVGDEHFLLGAEHFVGLAHEVYAAHDDDVRVGLCRLACQGQAVAYEVGHFLQRLVGVVVGQDDGVLFLRQAAYFCFQVNACGHGFVHVALCFPLGFYHDGVLSVSSTSRLMTVFIFLPLP